VVVVAVGGFLVYNDTTRGPLPMEDGALNVPGLENPVEILRDEWGIPHIYASTVHDLFFAQGYTHAQDRWWQMEFNRHIGKGQIEELTGKNDDVLGTDMFIRTVGWYESAQRDWEVLSEDNQAILQVADGVNTYIFPPRRRSGAGISSARCHRVNILIEPWAVTDTLV
jgi:penicillin amidase